LRLRSDFFAAALIRQCGTDNVAAVLRRRGAAEAGSIFVKIDRLDGTADLYGPAPQSMVEDSGERLFSPVMAGECVLDVEERIRREIKFDSDLWLIEIEDSEGRSFVPLSAQA
jgi:hypothetical protein